MVLPHHSFPKLIALSGGNRRRQSGAAVGDDQTELLALQSGPVERTLRNPAS
jgi:hypothetical protein